MFSTLLLYKKHLLSTHLEGLDGLEAFQLLHGDAFTVRLHDVIVFFVFKHLLETRLDEELFPEFLLHLKVR